MEVTKCVIQEAKSAAGIATATIELDNAITISNIQLTKDKHSNLTVVFPLSLGKDGNVESFIECKDKAFADTVAQAIGKEYQRTMDLPKLKDITLTVAECGEYHSLGQYYDGLTSISEACELYEKVKKESHNMIPAIGFEYKDEQLDIVSGNRLDMDLALMMPNIMNDKEALTELESVAENLQSRYNLNVIRDEQRGFTRTNN